MPNNDHDSYVFKISELDYRENFYNSVQPLLQMICAMSLVLNTDEFNEAAGFGSDKTWANNVVREMVKLKGNNTLARDLKGLQEKCGLLHNSHYGYWTGLRHILMPHVAPLVLNTIKNDLELIAILYKMDFLTEEDKLLWSILDDYYQEVVSGKKRPAYWNKEEERFVDPWYEDFRNYYVNSKHPNFVDIEPYWIDQVLLAFQQTIQVNVSLFNSWRCHYEQVRSNKQHVVECDKKLVALSVNF